MASKLINQVLTPNFMDIDSDIRVVPPSMSTYNMGLECMVIDGSLTKIIGNTIIPVDKPLPAGNNTVIGYGEDIQNQRGVYLIYNDLGDHSLYCYTLGATTSLQVAVSTVFNFQLSNIIRTVECVPSDNGTLCFWTDGYDNTSPTSFNDNDFNSGRQINIDLALAGFYNPFTLQSIQRIKYPPTNEPTAVYGTDANYGKNLFNPANKLCQFAYCWEYYDNSLSTYSPLSALAVPYGDETIDNSNSTVLSLLNNVINLTFNTGSYLVKQITLGVRFGNIGNFGTFITLNKKDLGIPNDVTNYPYAFYNDRNITILDQADWVRLYDQSPQVENDLRLVTTDTGSNLVPMQITEGFDNITPIIQLTSIAQDSAGFLQTVQALPQPTYTGSIVIASVIIPNQYTIPMPNQLVLGSIFSYTDLPNTGVWASEHTYTDTYTYSVIITQDMVNNPSLLVTDFYNWLVANHSNNGQYSFLVSGFNIIENVNILIINIPIPPYYIGIHNNRTVTTSYINTIAKISTFKSGFKKLFGIEYGRDEGWEGTVQAAEVTTTTQSNSANGNEIYIPFITQLGSGQGFSDEPFYWINFAISSRPPIWATKYRILMADTIPSFIQFNGVNINYSGINTTIQLTPLTTYGVPATTTAAASGANPSSILSYNYTPGDRCRLIAQWNGTDPGTSVNFNQYIDVEVLAYDAATSTLTIQSLTNIGGIFLNPTGDHNKIFLELYTPVKSTQTPIYYELSKTGNIGAPHTDQRFHEILDPNLDTYTNPPIGFNIPTPTFTGNVITYLMLTSGDCWLKLRKMVDANGDGYTTIVEEANFSDFYVSNSYDKGRPNVIDPFSKRQSLPYATHSQIYIYDTQINGLSSFWGFTTPLNPANGIITGSRMVGYELQLYQWQKVTSILIQRTQMTNANNTVNITKSTDFFGSHNPRSDRYGTIYPESIDGSKTHGYFFDVINGAFIRVAQDRNWNLSQLYKLNNWTLAMSAAMKNAGTENFNVFSHYDTSYDKMYWTIVYNIPEIIDGQPNPDYKFVPFTMNGITFKPPVTVIFCENGDKESKGFQGFAAFHPEYYGGIGEQFYSFKNGNMYKHWDWATPNLFYGGLPSDNAPVAIGVVENKSSETIKTYFSIEEYCDSILAAPNSGDIFTLPNMSYPNGMSSRLLPSKFNVQEGVISANFQKDLNTPNTIDPILNGRDLKGDAISVLLSNDDHNPLTLSKIIISAFVSPPTP